MAFTSNPRVTFNIVERDQYVGLEDQRALIVAQMLTGNATADELFVDVPRTDAEINALFGSRSHAAMLARQFRKINKYTNLDVKPLADDGSATKATAAILAAGTATAAAEIFVIVGSEEDHAYEVSVEIGDDPAAIMTKITSRVALDTVAPFTSAESGTPVDTITFTAANGGTLANDWPIIIRGIVPGVTFTLTAWTGGATDPSLTTVFDNLDNIRYQTVIWPAAYTQSVLDTWIEARKNVDNDVKDGRAFMYRDVPLATAKTEALAFNNSEVVYINAKPVDRAHWKGPHLPEIPDKLATNFAAARARRFEDGVSISDLVVTNESNDQFGGIHTASLPYFNTPLLGVGMPLRDSGYTLPEQLELEDAGVTVLGANRTHNAVIMGQVVTTRQNDDAGNEDETWKYLNWRDTHGNIREFFVLNNRKEFAQHRLSAGDAVAGYAIATEPLIRAFQYELYDKLADIVHTVRGQKARQFFEDSLKVTLEPELRRVRIYAVVPMVSQLGEILGTIKYTFKTS